MTLAALKELVAEVESTEDRLMRSEILIDLSKDFSEVPAYIAQRPFPDSQKSPACQSDAYVWVMRADDGTLRPFFAVENPQGLSAKALAAVLTKTCTGMNREEMMLVEEGIVHRLFGPTISMGKGEGLMGIIRKMKQLAAAA